jgi:enoyl-CoA hydratase/carnithine racemase
LSRLDKENTERGTVMNYETIIFEKKGAVAIVTLNRPEKRNAISELMSTELFQVFGEIENDDQFRAMILTGGPACFSGGADLSEVASGPGKPTGPNPFQLMANMTKPTIAAIAGPCVAGGLELALICDLRVASEKARIGDAHIRMGLIGGGGGPTRLARLIGVAKAMELVLTGYTVDGIEACRIGLVNQVFPQEKFLEGALELAEKIAANSALALQLSKKAVAGAAEMDEYQSLHYTDILIDQLLASAEFKERIAAFMAKGKEKKA